MTRFLSEINPHSKEPDWVPTREQSCYKSFLRSFSGAGLLSPSFRTPAFSFASNFATLKFNRDLHRTPGKSRGPGKIRTAINNHTLKQVDLIPVESRFFQMKPMNREAEALLFCHSCESRNPFVPGDAHFRGCRERVLVRHTRESGYPPQHRKPGDSRFHGNDKKAEQRENRQSLSRV
jgi:hypothetical protein